MGAELTGQLGVAMVTAGPGVTNTVTAVANAMLARMPGLVIGAAVMFAAFVLWRAIKLYQAIAADLAKRDA